MPELLLPLPEADFKFNRIAFYPLAGILTRAEQNQRSQMMLFDLSPPGLVRRDDYCLNLSG
jgi:hypothetical protein